MITKLKFAKFTAFEKLEVSCLSGVNIFVGENGTGKTHIMKAAYSACEITKSGKSLAEKIDKVFLPSKEQIGRLVKRGTTSVKGSFEITRTIEGSDKSISIRIGLSNHVQTPEKASISGAKKLWNEYPVSSVYIPVKDMMANAPGFRSLYNLRNIHFEEVYSDIIDRAFLDTLKGPADKQRKRILKILREAIDGNVIRKGEEFFLKNKQGELEFTLLAEGIRKLALLWLLINNGTLLRGAILFWDEPEANLNPRLMKPIVKILLELQREGVQVFLSTHSYVILKEFDIQSVPSDKMRFHALHREDGRGEIQCSSSDSYLNIHPNAIAETFTDIYSRDIEKSLG